MMSGFFSMLLFLFLASVDETEEMVESVRLFKQSQEEIELTPGFAISLETKERNSSRNVVNGFLVKSNEGMLIAYRVNLGSGKSETVVLISNARYTAGLASNQGKALSSLTTLQDIKLGMYGGGPAKSAANVATDYSRLFGQIDGGAFGHRDFSDSFQLWQENGARSISRRSEANRDWIEIVFQGWPSAVGDVVYRIEPKERIVREIEGTYQGGIKYKLAYLDYTKIGDISIPSKVVSSTTSTDGIRSDSETTWKTVQPSEIGFSEAQLYLPYYGIAEFDPERVMTTQKVPIWLIVLVILGVLSVVGSLMLFKSGLKR
jgi:hypothetical protein